MTQKVEVGVLDAPEQVIPVSIWDVYVSAENVEAIDRIDADSHQRALKAAEDISAIINRIDGIASSIAPSGDARTVTMNRMGSDFAARNPTVGVYQTQQASQELRQMARRLEAVVATFA